MPHRVFYIYTLHVRTHLLIQKLRDRSIDRAKLIEEDVLFGLQGGGDGAGEAAGAGILPLLRRKGARGGREQAIEILLSSDLLRLQAQVSLYSLLQAPRFVRRLNSIHYISEY